MQNRFDIGHGPMDRLDQAIDALDAFNWMLYVTLDQGDPENHHASGIHNLLTMQCRELDEARKGIWFKFDKEKLQDDDEAISCKVATNSDGPTISAKFDTNSEDHANFLRSETIAEDRPPQGERDVRSDFYRLQQEFIADQIAAGKDASDIAAGMLLAPDAVRRIIAGMPDRETREAWDRQEGRTVLRLGAATDTAEIAHALNLKQATVDRVADMLRGGAKSGADGGKENAA